MKIDKSKLDISQIFLTYMALVGDVEKVAVALNHPPAVIEQLAEEEGWREKVSRLCVLSKGGKPGDHERGVNRALNFVQAHQLRGVLSEMISHLANQSPEQTLEELTTRPRDKPAIISAKFLAELAAAMEKVQGMTYAALGDTLGERKDRDLAGNGELGADALHAAVITALNSSRTPKGIDPKDLVAGAQADVVKQLGQGDHVE
jgi:hypothetical protein